MYIATILANKQIVLAQKNELALSVAYLALCSVGLVSHCYSIELFASSVTPPPPLHINRTRHINIASISSTIPAIIQSKQSFQL